MAAKQKNDSSQENDKPKKPAGKSPVKKTTAAKPKATGAAKKTTAKKPVAKKPSAKKTAPKKPVAKKTTPKKPVARKAPVKKQPPVVADDGLGLDDISLDANDDAVVPVVEAQKKPEPKKEKPAPIAVPVEPLTAKKAPEVEEKKQPESVKEEEGKDGGLSPLLIIIVILALAAAAYFIFFNKDKEPEPVAPVEQKIEEPAVEQAPVPIVEEVQPVVEPEPEVTAELITISEQGGRFYVVVGSFYDEDLAIDKGNDIVATGNNAYLLKPTGEFKLHRVGINVGDRWSEAAKGLEELKSLYGDNIWVLKY